MRRQTANRFESSVRVINVLCHGAASCIFPPFRPVSWRATSPLVHSTCCGCCTSVCLTPLNVLSIYFPPRHCVFASVDDCTKHTDWVKKCTHTHTATLLCTCHSTVSCEERRKTLLLRRGKTRKVSFG